MEHGKPLTSSFMITTIEDVLPDDFNNILAVPQGEERLYGDFIYEANTNLYPLAKYSWNDYSVPAEGIVTILADKSIVPDSTAVPVLQNVTTVYIADSSEETIIGDYYLYIGADGDIDFTTVNPTNPSNWEKVKNLRFYDVIPSENSIYWKYIDIKNSLRHMDGTIWNQTIADEGDSIITNYYTFNDYVNTIAFFNMECTSIEITVRQESDNSILMEKQVVSLRDYQGIASAYDWFFEPTVIGKDTALVKIPIYRDIIIQIDYINTYSPPKVGETVFVRAKNTGKTGNKPQGRKKKFDIVTIDKDGKKSVQKSRTMIDEINYEVWIETNSLDRKIKEWERLINDDILIIGDETGKFTTLINYGYIKDMPYEIDSNTTHNKYSIKITTLI